MDDELVGASDGNVGGDARDGIGSGCDICVELNIVYIYVRMCDRSLIHTYNMI
jgi:hypothetical protein